MRENFQTQHGTNYMKKIFEGFIKLDIEYTKRILFLERDYELQTLINFPSLLYAFTEKNAKDSMIHSELYKDESFSEILEEKYNLSETDYRIIKKEPIIQEIEHCGFAYAMDRMLVDDFIELILDRIDKPKQAEKG